MNKTFTALAGEFYVMARLAHHGLIGSMTLSNTKGVDILVADPDSPKLFKLEVKTSFDSPTLEKFTINKGLHTDRCFAWRMDKKHEAINNPSLMFAFVLLDKPPLHPRFFIVPSRIVAEYVKKQHLFYEDHIGRSSNSNMRKFRIQIDDDSYEEKWTLFRNTAEQDAAANP